MRLTLLVFLAACSTPESFGERYERAVCANYNVCTDSDGEGMEDACDGYLAGTWTTDRCPDWTPDVERDQACIDALSSDTCDSQDACNRDLFGCE